MIRRVRRQFIAITMAMLTTVLMVPLVALNTITAAMSYNQTRNLLEQIAISETETWQNTPGGPSDLPPDDFSHGSAAIPAQTAVSSLSTSVETTETTTATTSDTAASQQASAVTGTEKAQSAAAPAVTTAPVPRQTAAAATTRHVSRETKPAATTAAPRTTAPPRSTKTTVRVTTAITYPRHTEAPPDPWPDPWPYPPYPEPGPDHGPYDAGNCMAIRPVAVQLLAAETVTATTDPADPPSRKPDPPRNDPRKGTVSIDHFLCYADADGNLLKLDGTDDYTEEDGAALLSYVVDCGKYDGTYGNLQFFRKDLEKGFLVVFSDRSAEHLLLKKLLFVSVLVFLVMEGIVLVLTMILTKRAMRPMQATFERQRQFISDAGHELKTPLTIISANVDILQDEIGKNKWLSYIHAQTERMRILVNEMMNLTKLEMGSPEKEFTTFSLSAAISSAALPFESQAFEQKKQLELDIQEDLQYTGNMEQIKQLVGIFMDNAMKYSNPEGEIRVTLQQTRDKKVLKFFNTGKGVTEEEKEKIFERFYRSDSSRARNTGGYGLGLSIAKSIADTHKIKIQVESIPDQWICFILTF